MDRFNRALLRATLTLGLAFTLAAPSHAATIWVSNTNDTGVGSLRQAITDANLTPLPDTIKFAIGSGVQTIQPQTPLPALTQPVQIDGTSQPGYAGTPLIELDGSVAGGAGLWLNAGNSTVKGLIINRFLRGIYIATAGGNVVRNSYIGTDPTGTLARANTETGIFIASGDGNIIGGTGGSDHNLISGNGSNGIAISAGDANQILGNRIGTNAAGTAALGNGGYAVRTFSSSNIIGVAIAGGGNLISGNGRGIGLEKPGTNNFIQNNWIGLNAAGTAALPNDTGIDVFGDGNAIGGIAVEARNVIVAKNTGISVSSGAAGTYIVNNRIGTNPAGTAALANQATVGTGIDVYDAIDTVIGGAAVGAGNLISGNYRGVTLREWSSATTMQRNIIGLNADGDAPLANAEGVNVGGADNVIGTPGAGNVISGNSDVGIVLTESLATGNVIQSNLIGVAANGTTLLGNYYFGIQIYGAIGNVIGGTDPGAGNTIAGNQWKGIFAWFGTGNAFLGNSIYGNADLGIDLDPQGLVANDPADADFGPNLGQNYPIVTAVSASPGNTTVQGRLESTPNAEFRIELFSNPSCDPSGFGEGKTFIGSGLVATDATGHGTFTVNLPFQVTDPFITATATTEGDDTSEFSPCAAVSGPNPGMLQIAEDPTLAWESDAKAHVVVTRSQGVSGTVTVQYEVTDGTATTPSDYTAVAGTLTFADGEVVKTIEIPIVLDMIAEGTEDLNVTLSAPTGGAVLGPQSTAKIMLFDYDPALPTVWFSDATVVEGNSGTKKAVFTVTLSPATSPRTVGYGTLDGTAIAGVDYTETTGQLVFNPGDPPKTVEVPIIGDTIDEGNEIFFLQVTSLQNATVSDGFGEGHIIDDDAFVATPPLTVKVAKLKKDSNPSQAVNKGGMSAKGTFLLDPAKPDVFDAMQPIGVRLEDSLGLDTNVVWQPNECKTSKRGRITCVSASKLSRAQFKPVAGGGFAFTVALKKTAAAGPFGGPVTVTLTYGNGSTREGAIASCKQSKSGLSCK